MGKQVEMEMRLKELQQRRARAESDWRSCGEPCCAWQGAQRCSREKWIWRLTPEISGMPM